MTGDPPISAASKSGEHPPTRRRGTGALRPYDEEGLCCLWDYVKQHGTSQVPHRHKATDGFLLGGWVSRRRKNRGEDPALDRLIESMPGWTWAPNERGFEERLAHYRRVTEAGIVNRHQALRMWASAQRRLVREGKVSADRMEQLQAAGII